MFAFLLPNLLCFQTLKKRCDEELRRRDLRTMQELDKKVMDQQGLLEKAGVPGFFVTNGRQEIQQQMYLLDFICRVAQSQWQGRWIRWYFLELAGGTTFYQRLCFWHVGSAASTVTSELSTLSALTRAWPGAQFQTTAVWECTGNWPTGAVTITSWQLRRLVSVVLTQPWTHTQKVTYVHIRLTVNMFIIHLCGQLKWFSNEMFVCHSFSVISQTVWIDFETSFLPKTFLMLVAYSNILFLFIACFHCATLQ